MSSKRVSRHVYESFYGSKNVSLFESVGYVSSGVEDILQGAGIMNGRNGRISGYISLLRREQQRC